MVRKPPANGVKFKPGQSGNPKGSSAKARSIGKLSRLTAEQVAEVGTMILGNDRAALKKLGEDPKASVLQVWMAGLVVNSMTKGESRTFTAVMDRIVGRAKETVELSGREGSPVSLEVARREMTEDEMRQRADALAKQRAQAGDD